MKTTDQQTEYIRELKAANEDLRLELANARAIGQRLRGKLGVEMARIGDAGDRDIADWDFFVSALVLPDASVANNAVSNDTTKSP